jgi:hypothetical protein
LIAQAIALNPKEPAYHGNLGNALRNGGKLDAAIAGRTSSKRRGSWAEAGEDLVLQPRVVAFDSLGSFALGAPLGKLVNLP